MPYNERDDREIESEQSELYEDNPAYSTDTYFGERLDSMETDETAEDPAEFEDGFGETVSDGDAGAAAEDIPSDRESAYAEEAEDELPDRKAE